MAPVRGVRPDRRAARSRHGRARRGAVGAPRHRSASADLCRRRTVARRNTPGLRSPRIARPPGGGSSQRRRRADHSRRPFSAGGETHELSAGRADLRGRAGEHLAAFEAASLRDVQEHSADGSPRSSSFAPTIIPLARSTSRGSTTSAPTAFRPSANSWTAATRTPTGSSSSRSLAPARNRPRGPTTSMAATAHRSSCNLQP